MNADDEGSDSHWTGEWESNWLSRQLWRVGSWFGCADTDRQHHHKRFHLMIIEQPRLEVISLTRITILGAHAIYVGIRRLVLVYPTAYAHIIFKHRTLRISKRWRWLWWFQSVMRGCEIYYNLISINLPSYLVNHIPSIKMMRDDDSCSFTWASCL